jgi:hypothetical protein
MTRPNVRVAEEDGYGLAKSKGGGLLTDRSSEPTRRVLRLAVQVPLVKGDDVEESQLRVSPATAVDDECVEFWPAGALAKGQFSCTACGNRVIVHQVLPRCSVCGERLWERAKWSPFARSDTSG